MMVNLQTMIDDFDEESRQIINRELQTSLVGATLDWRKFKVCSEYQSIIKSMLDKLEVWYFTCAEHELEILEKEPDEVRLCVSVLADWEEEEFVKILNPIKRRGKKKVQYVLICISKESKKRIERKRKWLVCTWEIWRWMSPGFLFVLCLFYRQFFLLMI